jgi:hypothetical protein
MNTFITALERSTLMIHPTAAPRLALWKAQLVVVVVAATTLLLAAHAGAAVLTPAPGAGTLAAAITTANTNADPSNTIILADGRYAPTAPLPAITKRLRITGDHANQQPTAGGGPRIDGTNQNPPDSDLITVNSGVNVTLEGFLITTSSNNSFAVVRDNGTVTLWNVALSGNNGIQLAVSAGATATVNDSSINDGNSTGIATAGTLTLNNSTVANNFGGGISKTGGTLALNNTIVANNNPAGLGTPDCDATATTQDHSMDSDGTCGVSFPSASPNLVATTTNGGPTPTLALGSGSPAIGAGDPAKCFLTDQRFFVHGGSGCDLGAYQTGATQDTTPPACVVTGLILGPPKQQQVTVSDSIAGLGPEGGALTDPTADNPADAVTNLAITNGSVASAPFSGSGPSTAGVVLTATKSDQALLTQWSFTATNWAGVSKLCR